MNVPRLVALCLWSLAALRGFGADPFAERATWLNVAEVLAAPDGDGFRLARVPSAVREKLNAAAQLRSFSPAGVELRFQLAGPEARVTLKYVEDRAPRTRGAPVLAEVWHGDFFLRTVVLRTEWTEIVVGPPKNLPELRQAAAANAGRFDPAVVRIVFPHGTEVRIKDVLGDVRPPRPEQLPRGRYLAYGSSITQGYDAARPSEPYPAQLARLLGADGINLGFGASAFLEPAMADWIASRQDWDAATFELGVNLIGRMPAEEFRARVRYFLSAVVPAHPAAWIFVTDLLPSFRDLAPNAKLAEYRAIVREEVARLNSPRVVHLPGESFVLPAGGLGADLLHPEAAGFTAIARRFLAAMREMSVRPKVSASAR